VYVVVLTADPVVDGKARVSQVYLSVLDRGSGFVRATQVYITVLENPIPKEYISMGAVADLLAAPKSFTVPSNLSRYLQKKTNDIDPDVPAAYGAKNEVNNVAVYSGTVSGGTFTITITLKNTAPFTTAAIAFDANAATIQTAIDTASPATVGDGHIVVTGGPLTTTPLVVTYSGATVAGQNHTVLSIDGASLTGGGAVGAITTSVEGQTARPARAVLYNLGVIADATPPVQGLTTAPTKGSNLLGVQPWVVRELCQEIAFEDQDNDIYQVLVGALLGYTDVAPLVYD